MVQMAKCEIWYPALQDDSPLSKKEETLVLREKAWDDIGVVSKSCEHAARFPGREFSGASSP
jgi:hypothetical protein